jgi:hypothetical protein
LISSRLTASASLRCTTRVQAGSIKLITLLLNRGIDINQADKQGMTPLGNIVLKNFHKTVEFVNLGTGIYRLDVNKKLPFQE